MTLQTIATFLRQPACTRAEARAELQDIAIVAAHASDYTVRGSTGTCYTVHEYSSGFSCTCKAGQQARLCKHVVTVARHILTIAQRRPASDIYYWD